MDTSIEPQDRWDAMRKAGWRMISVDTRGTGPLPNGAPWTPRHFVGLFVRRAVAGKRWPILWPLPSRRRATRKET